MSVQVLLDSIAPGHRAAADRMLNGELERRKRLKADLAADPGPRPGSTSRAFTGTTCSCSSSTPWRSISTVSPGARYAFNFAAAQLVLGVAAPIQFKGGDTDYGTFVYLSFERGF